MKQLFIMTHGPLKPKPVGLPMSVLRRCKAFATHGIKHTLLVNDHYVSFEESTQILRQDGLLSDGTEVRYMHNDLAGDGESDNRPAIDVMATMHGLRIVQDKDNPAVCRVYNEHGYIMFVYLENDRVSFIDNLRNGIRTSRSVYDRRGYIRKIEHMGRNNKPVRVEYLSRYGTTYLVSNIEASNGKISFLELYPGTDSAKAFDTTGELIAHWLSSMVLLKNRDTTLISEYGFFRKALQSLRTDWARLRIVYTLHNNHLGGSNQYGAPLKPELRDFFEHIHEYDSVVVLTEEQRMDIMKQFYPAGNIEVIPHHAVVDTASALPRDPYRVVLLGRYAEHKGQIDAVRGFRRVVDVVPEATLEMYGRGPTEGDIQDEIDKLGLTANVYLKGFSNGSKDVYSSAAIGLFPTMYEGFGLSIQECMQYGCVPIAYDSKYGIRALIRDGIDGMIIGRGNVRELADTILVLLRDRRLRDQYATHGSAVYDRFSEKSVVDRWMGLIEQIHGTRVPEPAFGAQ